MSKMQTVIRGVLKDPAVKNLDMFEPICQPVFSKAFIGEKLRTYLRYIGIEDYGLYKTFYVFAPLSIFLVYSQKIIFGVQTPMFHQSSLKAYHWQNLFSFYKTNADVHFSKLYNVHTNDKLYGMRQLPKRPWEAFKNPKEVMKNKSWKHRKEN